MPPSTANPSRRLRRSAEPRSAVAWAMVAVIAGGLAVPLGAQTAAAPATATAEVSLALARLQGGASWMGSAAGMLGLTSRLSVGGAGTVLLGARSLPGVARGNDQELRTAYGGLVLQLELARRGERRLWARVLGGAGNAKLDLAVIGTQIASDNFGVFVPEVGGTVALAGPLRVGAALGYRAVFGVEDLPGLSGGDLRGPWLRALVSVHRF